jgi:hypothetical protein
VTRWEADAFKAQLLAAAPGVLAPGFAHRNLGPVRTDAALPDVVQLADVPTQIDLDRLARRFSLRRAAERRQGQQGSTSAHEVTAIQYGGSSMKN